jgi:hypothetical protein
VDVDHTPAKLVGTVIAVLPEKFGAVYSDRPRTAFVEAPTAGLAILK